MTPEPKVIENADQLKKFLDEERGGIAHLHRAYHGGVGRMVWVLVEEEEEEDEDLGWCKTDQCSKYEL